MTAGSGAAASGGVQGAAPLAGVVFWRLMTVLVIFWWFGQLPKAVIWTLRYHRFWSHSSGTNFIANPSYSSSEISEFHPIEKFVSTNEIFQSDSVKHDSQIHPGIRFNTPFLTYF